MNLAPRTILSAALLGATAWAPHSAMAEDDALKIISPIPFHGVARLTTVRRKGKGYAGKALYPHFIMATPLTRLANIDLRTSATKGVLDFAKSSVSEIPGSPADTLPYDYSQAPALHFYAPHRLISLAIATSSYAGGIHGSYGTETENYGNLTGHSHPRKLTLADFFRPGSSYRTQVQKLIFDKLRATKGKGAEASWILDGSVKKLEPAQFNDFVVEKDGLRWFFDPYAVGPFVSGDFEVKLSATELGPNFKRAWLVG